MQDEGSKRTAQALNAFLPLLVGYFSINLPSGVGLYYFSNIIVTSGQQIYLRKLGGVPPVQQLCWLCGCAGMSLTCLALRWKVIFCCCRGERPARRRQGIGVEAGHRHWPGSPHWPGCRAGQPLHSLLYGPDQCLPRSNP